MGTLVIERPAQVTRPEGPPARLLEGLDTLPEPVIPSPPQSGAPKHVSRSLTRFQAARPRASGTSVGVAGGG
jgi:hypothetical protein